MRSSISAFMGSTSRKLKAFRNNCLGSVTQITAVATLPMLLAAGAAIDTIRINREQVAFDAAVDSAALAVAADDRASLQGLSDAQVTARIAELEEFARKYLAENYTPQYGSSQEMPVDIEITGQEIDLTASHSFPTTIMSLTGIDEINLTSSSQIKKAMRPIELVMVMDTTGSMATDNKITGAKNAAKSLLDTIYAGSVASVPESEFIRVGLVPFAAGVRLDKNAADFDLGWIDTTGVNPLSKLHFNNAAWHNYMAWGQMKTSSTTFLQWNGCVEARIRGDEASGEDYNANDAAPSLFTPATLFPAYFGMDEPAVSGYGYNNNYISGSGTPNETTGLASTSTSYTNHLNRQENTAKYVNKVITAENMTSENAGPWRGCAKSKVVPMTHKRSDIVDGINAMTAAGNTLIAEGLAWGMRVVSPTEPFTEVQGTASIPAATISPYNDVRWMKTVVLMTDGDNQLSAGTTTLNGTVNSAYGRGKEPTGSGYNRFGTTSNSSIMTALDDALIDVCNKIKANNVELYVTSFGDGVSSATRARLQSCATDADNYQHATSSADLQAFFNHIGEETLNKAIYVSK